MEKEDLKKFLDSMLSSIGQKEINLYKSIIEANNINTIEDHEEFFLAILYPFEQFVSGFVRSEIANNRDVIFIIKNQNYIKNNFSRIIKQKEGSSCSSDKSRTIMMSLLNHYKTGEKIVFNYDQEYTYHLPNKVFRTHDHIIKFYEGLKNLWYGDNAKYLEALALVL